MNTKKYLKLLSVNKKSDGFTLIELLVAIAMSGILVTIMGAGMMAILNSSKTSTSKANIKNQLNRAVDYINDDIKKARIAGISTTKKSNDTVIFTYFESLNSFSTPHTIKYYLDVASNPWLGPNVLRRQVDNGNWQVVVDGLTENTISATDFSCTGTGKTGTELTLGGFQACVEQATASNGSPLYRTTVALFGEISDTDGSNANSEILRVGTDTISRSVTPTLEPPVITFEDEFDTTPKLMWTAIQGASSYNIFKCTIADAIDVCDPTTLLQSVTGTTVTEPTETPGSRTCYRGKSVNGAVASEYGDIVCTIVASTVAPKEVSGLTASDVVQPLVSWIRDPEATEYDLYRCETSDPSSPCSINVGIDTPVETFTAITDTAFEDKVPWSESLVTGLMPSENKAFCYGVVSRNSAGSSGISNIDCGIANAPLTVDNTWNVQFDNSIDKTVIKLQNVTWSDNAAAVATSYEIRRCEATGGLTTCNPATEGKVVFDGLISPTDYDETTDPNPSNTFCYTVRAKNLTTISPFATTICAATRPPECILNMAALGQGSTLSYKSTATASERTTLESVVKGPFDNAPITQNIAKTGFGSVLHTIEENSSGSYQNAYKAVDTVTLPCTTQIRLSWYYPDTSLVAPTLSASVATKPTLSWTDSNSPQASYYQISRCETTGGASQCAPPNTVIASTAGFSWTQTSGGQPSTGNRFCYKIKGVFASGLSTPYSPTPACGAPNN